MYSSKPVPKKNSRTFPKSKYLYILNILNICNRFMWKRYSYRHELCLFHYVGDVQALASRDLPTTTVTAGNNNKPEHLEYVAFVLVPVFFIMGLLGILICHVLKKKGYRCTTEAEEVEEEEKPDEKIGNQHV